MDKIRAFLNAATGEFLWAVILVPILAISWIGFYTVARGIGIPPLFAAGMSAAFDGIALFAARIGLKHRRKGFSGYLARVTVIAFAGLGAFVQSFHAESQSWIHAHSWVVWSTAPIAACLAYELHLGWVHRKQLVRQGYQHPSAKSGFGPMTWIRFPRETWDEHSAVLRARRAYIAKSNLRRFELEESAQPQLSATAPVEPVKVAHKNVNVSRPKPKPEPEPKPVLHSVPSRPAPKPATRKSTSGQAAIRDWCREHGYELGFNGRVPIAGLNAYRAAQRAS